MPGKRKKYDPDKSYSMSKNGFFHVPTKGFNVLLGYPVGEPRTSKVDNKIEIMK